ncbi:MAG: hypothetical protein JSS02_11060 [Planctomycetes bacterium]|nr:hypothetical protein [Planctomycetota bacterium]
MKAFLLTALVFVLCGPARAADEKVNPAGTWQCEYTIGEQKRTSTLVLKKEKDALVGAMTWPDQKDEALKDLKFQNGKLTFSAVRKFMGNMIPIDYTLTMEGDKLKGKGASDFGGQAFEFEITGARETANPVGTWQCAYTIGDQKRTSTLVLKKEGDALVGTMTWPDQKDEKLQNPKFQEGKLTFSAERKLMGNTIPIDYTFTIEGDQLKGKGASDFGGQKREFEIEGQREKKPS